MPRKKKRTVSPKVLILEGLWSDTARAVRAAGGMPTEITPWEYGAVEEALLSGTYDAMILTGGADISPALYDAKPNGAYGCDKLRDATEFMALHHARLQGLPVLGICRGSQIMNAYMGGTLCQHLGNHHSGRDHWVEATSDCRTFTRAINSDSMHVVSLHHQCVETVGADMKIGAMSLDGIPEAVESKDGLLLGVQFHPELAAFQNPQAYAIFQWLVRQGARRAGGRAPYRPFRTASRRRYQWDGEKWDDIYDDDAWDASPSPVNKHLAKERKALPPAGGTSSSTTGAAPFERKHRKAGDPAIPSMRAASTCGAVEREYVDATAIECDGSCNYGICGCTDETGEPLKICPECALIFDNAEDRDDHLEVIHGINPMRDSYNGLTPPFMHVEDRYPELQPPPGHPAWDDPEDDERKMLDKWLERHPSPGHNVD